MNLPLSLSSGRGLQVDGGPQHVLPRPDPGRGPRQGEGAGALRGLRQRGHRVLPPDGAAAGTAGREGLPCHGQDGQIGKEDKDKAAVRSDCMFMVSFSRTFLR